MDEVIELLLCGAGLVLADLDERTPKAVLSSAVTASGRSDGLLEATERSIGNVAATQCVRAILIALFTEADRWTWRRPNPDGRLVDPSWIEMAGGSSARGRRERSFGALDSGIVNGSSASRRQVQALQRRALLHVTGSS